MMVNLPTYIWPQLVKRGIHRSNINSTMHEENMCNCLCFWCVSQFPRCLGRMAWRTRCEISLFQFFRLSSSGLSGTNTGQIISLISNDVYRFETVGKCMISHDMETRSAKLALYEENNLVFPHKKPLMRYFNGHRCIDYIWYGGAVMLNVLNINV